MSVLDSFLSQILQSLRQKNGHRITELIVLDLDSLPHAKRKPYEELHAELNSRFTKGKDASLSVRIKQALPSEEFGSFHSPFTESIIQYFRYLRDFATTDNLTKALSIRQLTSQCITALGDSRYGVVMIPIVLSFSRVLGSIATNLDRNAGLTSQTGAVNTDADTAGGGKISFVENTANVLRDAFIKCLAGSPGTPRTSKPAPDDKRSGIYLAANSCMKLLYRCRKIRNAQQMFTSIDAQSPPLSFYPAAQRVTFLYYLGRYHFANNHFYRAQNVLQCAYDECHREAISHRRLILIHLIASNICLGKFPSSKLLMRREAETMAKPFNSVCRIIKSGDIGGLEEFLNPTRSDNEQARWFLSKKVLLQMQNRCEVLAWRSLILRVFEISGYKGEGNKVPYLRLDAVLKAAQWSYSRSKAAQRTKTTQPVSTPAPSFGSGLFSSVIATVQANADDSDSDDYVDPDFQDMPSALNETGFDPESGAYIDDWINNNPHASSYTPSANITPRPNAEEVESIFLSLIQQGFLRGFVFHGNTSTAENSIHGKSSTMMTNSRFAIPGAKGGWKAKGFPSVWEVVKEKMDSEGDGDDTVPGWVTERKIGMGAGGTGGMMAGRPQLGGVVRLSGARPVGMGA